MAMAVYYALCKTYGFLTPDLWEETVFSAAPAQEFTDHLAKMSVAKNY
jgi:small subunit ribosomal protein S2e